MYSKVFIIEKEANDCKDYHSKGEPYWHGLVLFEQYDAFAVVRPTMSMTHLRSGDNCGFVTPQIYVMIILMIIMVIKGIMIIIITMLIIIIMILIIIINIINTQEERSPTHNDRLILCCGLLVRDMAV